MDGLCHLPFHLEEGGPRKESKYLLVHGLPGPGASLWVFLLLTWVRNLGGLA